MAEAVGNAVKLNRHLWLVSPLYGALFTFRPAANVITAAHQGISVAWCIWVWKGGAGGTGYGLGSAEGMRSSSCLRSP